MTDAAFEISKQLGGAVSDRILNLAQLEALYEQPSRNSLVKVRATYHAVIWRLDRGRAVLCIEHSGP
jgi:hypothetical protein